MPSGEPIDLVCLGRAAVDLYAEERGSDLDEAVWFRKSLGGSAANTAVAASRQGLSVAMLTVVGADPFGLFVRRALSAEGIDVSAIRVDGEHLTGLVVLGLRAPSDAPHLFYRDACADMMLGPSDVEARLVANARMLLLTGTHLSTPSTHAASLRAIDVAREAGVFVALDVDYRPSLWGAAPKGRGEARAEPSEAARKVYREIIPHCALVVGTEEEIRVAGGKHDTESAERTLLEAGAGEVVTKRGARGSRARTARGEVQALDGAVIRVVNAIGAGDAFLGAYLAAWARGEDIAARLRSANAAGALVAARHGCAPAMPTRSETEKFMSSAPAVAIPDDETHWRATRTASPKRLLVLALDHRRYFEELFDAHGVGRERIAHLKGLVFAGGQAAFREAGLDARETGFIVDAEYGAPLLVREKDRWRARPIEIPSEAPIAFAGGVDVALELLRWPTRQIVKCKAVYHPDADGSTRRAIEAALCELQRACRRLDRTLLLEVVPAIGAREDFGATARAVDALYAAGLAPDWWKLPPPNDDLVWASLDRVVAARDPACSGILLLGNGLNRSALRERIARARQSACCRGFAFGRTVFAEAAAAWARAEIDDAGAVEAVRARLSELIELWSTDAP